MGEIEEIQQVKSISGDETLSVTVDGNFMKEALKAIKKEEVSLGLGGSMRPILLRPIGDESHIQLISPVRSPVGKVRVSRPHSERFL